MSFQRSCPLLVLVLVIVKEAVGQVCTDNRLGLYRAVCQPCGSPGLDDFCVKRVGRCGQYTSNTIGGATGATGQIAPVGYLGGFINQAGGVPPSSCLALYSAAVRTGTGITVYKTAGDWGSSLPGVYFNSQILNLLYQVTPTSDCLENNSPYPNMVWNNLPGSPQRMDSFYYIDNGNSTWSYQCYCDFCYSCQGCTSG